MFGLVTAPQGSTPQYTADQIKPIEELYAKVPEADAYTAIAGFPTVVDGNAVLRLKPWEERKRKQQEIADELRPKFAAIPGRHRVPAQSAVARPVLPLDADRVRRDVAGAVRGAAAHRRPLPRGSPQVSRRAEPADRPAAQHARGARRDQPRQALATSACGVDTVGPHARDDARRPAGHALQERGRAVRRDRAGRAARPHDAGRHQRRYVRARDGEHGAAVEPRRCPRRRVAPQSLNHFNRLRAVKVTAHARARLRDRRSAEGDERGGARVAAEHRADRSRRPVARVPLVGRRDLLHVRAGADVHLSRALRAVRELRRTRSSSCSRCRCR